MILTRVSAPQARPQNLMLKALHVLTPAGADEELYDGKSADIWSGRDIKL